MRIWVQPWFRKRFSSQVAKGGRYEVNGFIPGQRDDEPYCIERFENKVGYILMCLLLTLAKIAIDCMLDDPPVFVPVAPILGHVLEPVQRKQGP